MQKFDKIIKLILFGPKCQNLEIWAQTFPNTNVNIELRTFKIGYIQNIMKIRKLIPFTPKCLNLDIWA